MNGTIMVADGGDMSRKTLQTVSEAATFGFTASQVWAPLAKSTCQWTNKACRPANPRRSCPRLDLARKPSCWSRTI